MIFYSLGISLALAGLWVASFFSSKLAEGWRGRRGLTARLRLFRHTHPGELVWFHVASAGELEQALPILSRLRAERTQAGRPVQIFVSYFSPSGRTAIENECRRCALNGKLPPWDYSDYLCWDTLRATAEMVEALNPSAVVLLHAELWPALLHTLGRKRIPVALLGFYLPTVSALASLLLRRAFQAVTSIGTVDEATRRSLLERFPHKEVFVSGDPRLLRVQQRLQVVSCPEGQRVLGIVLASLEKRDWEVLCPWVVRQVGKLVFYIVPHDPKPDFLERIERDLAGTIVSRLSEMPDRPFSSGTFLIDRVGFLAELYQLAPLAFLGGGLSHGTHNVLEPAAVGSAIVTGPKIANSPEALALEKQGALLRPKSAQEIPLVLDRLLEDPLLQQRLESRARNALDTMASQAFRMPPLLVPVS